jgi:hypothetical protein
MLNRGCCLSSPPTTTFSSTYFRSKSNMNYRRWYTCQVVGELNRQETLKRLEATIESLASSVDLSGARIKNAVLASLFVARRSREPLAMTHLLRGVERELSKEGRAISTREQERLVRDA